MASQAVASDPQASVSFASLTVPHNAIGTMVISVTDPAGNTTALYSGATTIDVIAPAAPTYTPNFNLVADAQAKRKGLVDMTWSPTYDDGATAASGAHSGYDVRWSTSSVPNNNALVAFTDFFSGVANPEATVAWSANPITRQYKLPPINTYYIVVRAKDEVGNYSAYPAAVPSLANPWVKISVANPSLAANASSETFGQMLLANVSINADAVPDLIVAAPARTQGATANSGGVNIFYGKAGFAPTGPCVLPDCQELKPYDNAAGLYGTDLSASGDVGNVGAEVKPDLIVAQPTYAAAGFSGRAFLYFGGTGTSIEDRQMSATVPGGFVEFRCTTGTSFASAARIIRDIDGDGLDDIAITAHAALANQGQVYIFKGRSAAAWDTARSLTDGTGNKYVPCATATWTLDGPTPVATGGNQFARMRWGIVSLGNVKGDKNGVTGKDIFDFGIPSSKEATSPASTVINRYWMYSGLTVSSAVTNVPFTAARRVDPTGVQGNSALTDGFGRTAVGGLDFGGAALFDLAIGYPLQNRLEVLFDLTASDLLPANSGTRTSTPIQGATSSNFGYALSAGDVSGDGAQDLVIGEAPNTAVLPIPGRAWVFYQRTTAFDTAPGTFWCSELKNLTTGSHMGRITGVGDVNGDGAGDLVLGDEIGSAVSIWSWQ